MKNPKKDKNDDSLQAEHLGDVHGSLSGARPPLWEAILKKCIHIAWIWLLVAKKNTQSVVHYQK